MTGYPCTHFSLANPVDDGADDLPRLLRRIAGMIEDLDLEPMDILDLTVSDEITADDRWWSVTLYYRKDEAAPEEQGVS